MNKANTHRKMAVLGLGKQTLCHYRPDPEVATIGVNDIFRYHPVDYLVVIDYMIDPIHIPGYNDDRLNEYQVTKNSRPKLFLSNQPKWEFMPNYQKINLVYNFWRENEALIYHLDDPGQIPCSNNSPFVAACICHSWFGAKEITLYGVDFINHAHNFNQEQQQLDKCIEHWQILYNGLQKRGVKLFVGGPESALAGFIPVKK